MDSLWTPTLLAWFAPGITAVLLLACAGFLLRFVLPGLLLARTIGTAIRQLRKLIEADTLAPDVIAKNVMISPQLAIAWREYSHTLHLQRVSPPRWRATTGAELYFTEHALVATPLKTEFYKHLPGILTGIGILGTFSGLILGLSQFAVSSDASAVRGSLNALIQSVGHAFQISAAAIALAMLFTWVEKSLVTLLSRRVTTLVQLIDGLYEGGSSEEYLARLVRSSEASGQQHLALRDALIDTVRQAFAEMAAQQREAQAQNRQQLSGDLAQALVDGLREPMQRLAQSIESAGRNPAQSLASHLEQTLTKFSSALERHAAAEAEASALRQREGNAQTERLLRELANQVGALGNEIQRSSSLARQGTEQVINSSRSANEDLERGAALLGKACGELVAASRSIGTVSAQLADSGQRVELAASAMSAAAGREQESLAAHARLQESLAAGLAALRSTVDSARREASLSADLIARLEAGAQQLGKAEQSAEHYLAGVNAVLGEAHGAFARSMERTLREGNQQFQRELAEAVEHLRSTIDELSDALDAALARA